MTAVNIMKVVENNRKRRCNDPVEAAGWHLYSSNMGALSTAIWINDFTTGRYYMSGSLIAFQDEADAIIFALSQ